MQAGYRVARASSMRAADLGTDEAATWPDSSNTLIFSSGPLDSDHNDGFLPVFTVGSQNPRLQFGQHFLSPSQYDADRQKLHGAPPGLPA